MNIQAGAGEGLDPEELVEIKVKVPRRLRAVLLRVKKLQGRPYQEVVAEALEEWVSARRSRGEADGL